MQQPFDLSPIVFELSAGLTLAMGLVVVLNPAMLLPAHTSTGQQHVAHVLLGAIVIGAPSLIVVLLAHLALRCLITRHEEGSARPLLVLVLALGLA